MPNPDESSTGERGTGERIKEQRRRARLSQRALAQRIPYIVVRCLGPGCAATSGPSPSHIDPDHWALKHAGRTGHTTYDEVARCRLVATPKDPR